MSRFFTATQEKDLAILAETSVVGFPGAVHSWKVEGLTEERQEVYLINTLQKELDRARQVRVSHHRALRRFRREHKNTLAQFRSQMNDQLDFAAKGENNEELFSTWQKIEKADRVSKSRLDSLRQKVEIEREGARKSMATWTSIDEFDGHVTVRDVLVSVDQGGGKTLDYRLTLKKYTLEHKKEKTRPEARWILTEIQGRGSP